MSVLQIRRQSKTWLARRASEGLLLPRLRVGLTTGSGLTNRTSRQNVFGFGTRATPEEKAALEIYITGRFGERIKEPTFWENKYVAKRIFQRGLAEAIVARTPTPSPEELARAVKIAYPEGDPLEAYEAYEEELATLLSPEELHGIPLWLLFPLMFGVCFAMVSVMLLSLMSIAVAMIFRGGLLWRLFSIAAVTRDGQLAARWRLTWRQLLAWFPILFLLVAPFTPLSELPWFEESWEILCVVGLGLIVTSACFLKRSIPDRLAGTWLVIR